MSHGQELHWFWKLDVIPKDALPSSYKIDGTFKIFSSFFSKISSYQEQLWANLGEKTQNLLIFYFFFAAKSLKLPIEFKNRKLMSCVHPNLLKNLFFDKELNDHMDESREHWTQTEYKFLSFISCITIDISLLHEVLRLRLFLDLKFIFAQLSYQFKNTCKMREFKQTTGIFQLKLFGNYIKNYWKDRNWPFFPDEILKAVMRPSLLKLDWYCPLMHVTLE